MSTTVVKSIARRPRTPTPAMRARILAAAARAFSRAGYDAVGVREIAAAAETDAALVIRLFGSKAGLFEQLADAAFGDEEVFEGPLEALGARLATHLASSPPAEADEDDRDDFQFLLRSATSLTAAPILSAALHRALIRPLGGRIGEPDGCARAAIITSIVLGFATLRFALGSQAVEQASGANVARYLGTAIQTVIDR